MTMFSGPRIGPDTVSVIGVQTDLFSTLASLENITLQPRPKDSFDLSATLRNGEKGLRNFAPFFLGSELQTFRVEDHKRHFIAQGAYGVPLKKRMHIAPLVIDLVNDIAGILGISTENKDLTAERIKRALCFKKSLETVPSILDTQFQ